MAKDTTDDGSSSDEKKRGQRKKLSPSRLQAWTFPKNTLEEAIAVPKAIEDKHGGNPMDASLLAKAVGYHKSSDWRFLDLLKSANLYGLVKGRGANSVVSLEKIGQDVVAPGSPKERRDALLSAFQNVPDFKQVDDFYGGKRIPEDEYFLNTLTRQFNIPRDRASVFAEIFRRNTGFLKSFDISTGVEPPGDIPKTREIEGTVSTTDVGKDRRIREFLDTCFVMMPFGNWSTATIRTYMSRQSKMQVSNLLGPTNFLIQEASWNRFGNKLQSLVCCLLTLPGRMRMCFTNWVYRMQQ